MLQISYLCLLQKGQEAFYLLVALQAAVVELEEGGSVRDVVFRILLLSS